MTRIRRGVAAVLVAGLMGVGAAGDLQAQAGAVDPSGAVDQAGTADQPETTTPPRTERRYLRHVLRVGHDLVLGPQSEVREVIVILGGAELNGRVAGDVFVWFGDVTLGPTAEIEGSLLVVAGDVTIPAEAVVDDDLAVVGGRIVGTENYRPGREFVLIGPPVVGDAARSIVPWVTQGLLLARPIVPSLGWVWTIVGIFFVLSIALTLIFGKAVRSSADVVVRRPLRTFLTGLVVLIISGPLLVIFAATVVGIVVLPVVLFGLFIAWTVGKVGVTRGIGQRVILESDPDSRGQAVRSVVVGFALLTVAYMVPVLGIISWSLVSVFGLGAATIAVMAALREEYPRKPRKAKKAKGAEPPDAPPDPTPPDPERGPAGPSSSSGSSGPGLSSGPDQAPAAGLSASSAFVASDPVPEAAPPPQEGPAPSGSGPSEPATPPPPPGSDGLGPRAQFLERTAAFALDCVLIAIVDLLLDSRQDGMYFILLLSYHIGFWTWQGTTLGGIIVGLRVIRTDGEPLRFVDALVRGLASVFSFAVLGIGCLWMLQDSERQTWHDMIAGTYVIKVPREWLLQSTPAGGAK